MSRTYRDYAKQIYCHKCVGELYDLGIPGVWKWTGGVCKHHPRPWTRQHNKRLYKYRNPGKHSSCCQGLSPQAWRWDLFWLRFDVLKSEGY